ncbi:hypothetical protein RUMGNA_03044 [Mediterraneibacter gnavus ATCC 29149]|uniref:Uncharacterized protein n=1 Tax=Mediterraneibacter gnavus (strain ATCC 29149 / DSM 114966 / JCM 6515 / VPI C7-9) TaxID=411470 RepID=A7B633_MEDG7|nr:hypothetical protein RUMGNA_03044 [Mediterraneibacter gnavus ATCC 29149]
MVKSDIQKGSFCTLKCTLDVYTSCHIDENQCDNSTFFFYKNVLY